MFRFLAAKNIFNLETKLVAVSIFWINITFHVVLCGFLWPLYLMYDFSQQKPDFLVTNRSRVYELPKNKVFYINPSSILVPRRPEQTMTKVEEEENHCESSIKLEVDNNRQVVKSELQNILHPSSMPMVDI